MIISAKKFIFYAKKTFSAKFAGAFDWIYMVMDMVTDFVPGITFSHKILVKIRLPFGPPPPFHSNFIGKYYPRKNP